MKLVVLTPTNQEQIIALACQTLQKGGLVVYPTETTYGIGADCENLKAINKLLDYKSKREGKAFSVAVSTQEMAQKYVVLNATAKNVYQTFLPGPVTVISHSKGTTAPGVASREGTVGIRISSLPFVSELITAFGKGITATGANASYQKRPYTIQDILNHTSAKQKALIDLVIDAGELPHREPSTVIDTTLDDIKVARFGEIGFSKKEVVKTHNEWETQTLAKNLISRYRSNPTYQSLIFALTGPMGAGKTYFTKGIAQGLGILSPVTSPTYALANEYPFTSEGRQGLMVHIDAWKMADASQLKELDLPKYISDQAVIVVEWADKFADYFETLGNKAQIIWINLEPNGDFDRVITVMHP